MKTVVCGLGKCGSRMVLDLNALIFGGEYSCQLRNLDANSGKENLWNKFLKIIQGEKNLALAKDIHGDEVPPMHLGDSDGQNEVINMCRVKSGDEAEQQRREKLLGGIVPFENYHDACGQYHIIGEVVMRNLFETNRDIKPLIIDAYIKKNDKENVSAYFLLFSAGGGTGCGTTSVLAEMIASRANEQYHNMLIAGIAALPDKNESENYKISAGRFLTKFLSSPRSTSFDTVITVSNAIMAGIDTDLTHVQTQANMFAAHLIFSIINSSSKYNRSSVNTDGPELRKNIHGLAYFCFAQQPAADVDGSLMTGLEMLEKSLSPVSTPDLNQKNPKPLSFEGTSISFVDRDDFTMEDWEDMLQKIASFREFVTAGSNYDEDDLSDGADNMIKGDIKALESKLNELFDDPLHQLPLPMRSCKNVVILRGIPEDYKSSQWEQTCLTTLVEALFPKARVHYYATYHNMKEHTLTLIPSDYLSAEIVDMIISYLSNVWEKEAEEDTIVDMLLSEKEDVSENDVIDNIGEHEMFERYFKDFVRMRANTTGRFGLDDDYWQDKYVNAAQVADMMNNVHEIVSNVKREKKQKKARRSLGI